MRRGSPPDRVLATVLFTDIVGSTEHAAQIGDRRWQDLVRRHHAVVRAELKRFRGREIDTAGDGFFATFERPAQAIACALAIVDRVRPLGINIRAGLHAGELELSGGKLGGIAVHTAARVVAAAAPAEILVTATVRDLVAGSEIEFADRGTAMLKGVPGEWHLFSVVAPEPVAEAALEPATGAVGHPAATSRGRDRLSRAWAFTGLVAVVALLIVAAAAVVPRLLPATIVPAVNSVARIDAAGNRFDLVVSVGERPIGLASGDGAVWAINFTAGTLTRIDAASGEALSSTAVGGSPTGIAYGTNAVWMTTAFGLRSGEIGSVVRFSPSLGRGEADVPVGSGVEAIAFGQEGLWAANQLRNAVVKIDPSTNTVEREIPVGEAPNAIAVGAGSIWVGSALDDLVHRLDAVSYESQARIPIEGPTAITIGPDFAWVTSESADLLTRIDLRSNTSATFDQIGNEPGGVAVAQGGVWVALGQPGLVVRVDPATGVVGTKLAVDGHADALVVDGNGHVWVSVRDP